MELHGINRSLDDTRSAREVQQRREAQSEGAPQARSETQAPEAAGVVAASRDEGAETRDPAAERQTADHTAQLAERLRDFATAARLPANTRLSIEVDTDKQETRFLIVEKETGEVVREIPSDETKGILDQLADRSGFVVDRRL